MKRKWPPKLRNNPAGPLQAARFFIFTKIINRDIPADIIYEDELSLAFRDINPQAPFHILIIPKKAIATINDITEKDAPIVGHLYVVAAKIAKQQGFSDDGFRVVMNCNEHGGQTVYHIHLHMLAGKCMGWPPYQDNKKEDNHFNNTIKGEEILYDDFSSNTNNWSETNDESAHFYFNNGKYYLKHKRNEKGWAAFGVFVIHTNVSEEFFMVLF